jgi:hypothetical protein
MRLEWTGESIRQQSHIFQSGHRPKTVRERPFYPTVSDVQRSQIGIVEEKLAWESTRKSSPVQDKSFEFWAGELSFKRSNDIETLQFKVPKVRQERHLRREGTNHRIILIEGVRPFAFSTKR